MVHGPNFVPQRGCANKKPGANTPSSWTASSKTGWSCSEDRSAKVNALTHLRSRRRDDDPGSHGSGPVASMGILEIGQIEPWSIWLDGLGVTKDR